MCSSESLQMASDLCHCNPWPLVGKCCSAWNLLHYTARIIWDDCQSCAERCPLSTCEHPVSRIHLRDCWGLDGDPQTGVGGSEPQGPFSRDWNGQTGLIQAWVGWWCLGKAWWWCLGKPSAWAKHRSSSCSWVLSTEPIGRLWKQCSKEMQGLWQGRQYGAQTSVQKGPTKTKNKPRGVVFKSSWSMRSNYWSGGPGWIPGPGLMHFPWL